MDIIKVHVGLLVCEINFQSENSTIILCNNAKQYKSMLSVNLDLVLVQYEYYHLEHHILS